jgi:hypothetical protein
MFYSSILMNSYYIYDTKNGYFNAVALFGKKGPKREQKGSKKGKKYLGGCDIFIVLVPCCFSSLFGPFFPKRAAAFLRPLS